MNCTGQFSRTSGVQFATFRPDCIFDAEFERIYASMNKKIASTEAHNLEAVRTFLTPFYKGGGFIRVKRTVLESKYGPANNHIPFKKMYRLMEDGGVVSEVADRSFVDVRVNADVAPSCEKFITQGTLGSRLEEIVVALRKNN